jgi:hypothetical protein
MTSSSVQGDRRRLRMARIAVATFFFLNGVMTATLSARLPAIQTKLALPPGQLGLALLGYTVKNTFLYFLAKNWRYLVFWVDIELLST